MINTVDLGSLRAALKDESLFVRALAARALGVRGDKGAAELLAKLASSDPNHVVRIEAVEALALLKVKPEVIELAKNDRHMGVKWAARLAGDELQDNGDYAVQLRRAYAVGIARKEMGIAAVGKRAPDFKLQTSEGEWFALSSILGKKPIAIYFAAFDG